MAEQQALNATFFAFKKRDKMVLLPATVTMILLLIALMAGFLWLSRDAVADYFRWIMSISQEMKPGVPPSPEMMMPPASVMNLGGVYFLFLFVQYVLIASYEAACLRWMIRGETGGLMGLTLGADTWRVYFTYWLWFLLLIAFYIVCLIVVATTIGAGVFASMQGKGEAGATPWAMIFLPFALGLALLAVLVYFAVRFAPAAATSIAERRFAFFDAWKVSRGRFWSLFGAFVILYLMVIVGYFILAFALGMLMATMMMGQMGSVTAAGGKPSPEQVMALFMTPNFLVPMAIFYLVIIAAVMTFIVALYGVNARAAMAAIEEGKISAAT